MDKELSDASIAGPAITVFRSALALAWAGTDGEGRLNVALGAEFADYRTGTLDQFSPARPALASFGDRLYLAWVGPGAKRPLNVASSADGVHFDRRILLDEFSAYGPSLAVAFGRLYLAWTGTDGAGELNLAWSPDGASLAGKVTFAETLTGGPAMAGNQLSGSDERLFLAWTGTDLPHHLNFAAGFAPGSEGTYEKFVYDGSDPWGVGPQSSLTGPALASNPVEFDTTLAYIGDGGDGRVFVLSSGPNPTHEASFDIPKYPQDLEERSIDTPALAAPHLFRTWLAWTGTDQGHHLNRFWVS